MGIFACVCGNTGWQWCWSSGRGSRLRGFALRTCGPARLAVHAGEREQALAAAVATLGALGEVRQVALAAREAPLTQA